MQRNHTGVSFAQWFGRGVAEQCAGSAVTPDKHMCCPGKIVRKEWLEPCLQTDASFGTVGAIPSQAFLVQRVIQLGRRLLRARQHSSGKRSAARRSHWAINGRSIG